MLAGLLLFSTPILAHHGYAAYDMTANRSMKGTITNFTMANPHSQISFDVKDASGNVEHRTVETGARCVWDEGAEASTSDSFPSQGTWLAINSSSGEGAQCMWGC